MAIAINSFLPPDALKIQKSILPPNIREGNETQPYHTEETWLYKPYEEITELNKVLSGLTEEKRGLDSEIHKLNLQLNALAISHTNALTPNSRSRQNASTINQEWQIATSKLLRLRSLLGNVESRIQALTIEKVTLQPETVLPPQNKLTVLNKISHLKFQLGMREKWIKEGEQESPDNKVIDKVYSEKKFIIANTLPTTPTRDFNPKKDNIELKKRYDVTDLEIDNYRRNIWIVELSSIFSEVVPEGGLRGAVGGNDVWYAYDLGKSPKGSPKKNVWVLSRGDRGYRIRFSESGQIMYINAGQDGKNQPLVFIGATLKK